MMVNCDMISRCDEIYSLGRLRWSGSDGGNRCGKRIGAAHASSICDPGTGVTIDIRRSKSTQKVLRYIDDDDTCILSSEREGHPPFRVGHLFGLLSVSSGGGIAARSESSPPLKESSRCR